VVTTLNRTEGQEITATTVIIAIDALSIIIVIKEVAAITLIAIEINSRALHAISNNKQEAQLQKDKDVHRVPHNRPRILVQKDLIIGIETSVLILETENLRTEVVMERDRIISVARHENPAHF
jgi:hypothetical protein